MYANLTGKHPSLTAPRRWLIAVGMIALAGLALLTSPAAAEPQPVGGDAKPEVCHFRSGDKDVGVECFAPAGAGKYPVLVTLPAVDGARGAWAERYHWAARTYARQGYVVLLVHYYDRTGAAPKDIEGYRELFVNYFRRKGHTVEDAKKMAALSDQWIEVVRDAVQFARARPNVDGERVGLVGFSLGATLALTAAARHDMKLAALVEFFGTLPRELHPDLKKLPPTLIFHGDADGVVPVQEAYMLIGLLDVRKLMHEHEVYSGVGHMFTLDGKEQSGSFFAAKLRTDVFLDKHLKPAAVVARGK